MQQYLPAPSRPLSADIKACRHLLRGGSRTFYAASFLLPREVREPASALYAFCRLADDAVDVDEKSGDTIPKLLERLNRAYDGHSFPNPVDRAFAATIERYRIPRELPEGLIAGLAWDAQGRTIADLDELLAYAVGVAGTVGAMMAALMRVRDPALVARACDLGIAMQLTNIARDVGEDARTGRLYLPRSWLRDAGIDPDDWLVNPKFTDTLGGVVGRVLDMADDFYERADMAIEELPRSCRPGIRAARLLYAEIGHELRRTGCDSLSKRTIVSPRRKVELLAKAIVGSRPKTMQVAQGCVREAQFLVDAMVAVASSENAPPRPSWWNLHGQAIQLIDLFEQIERRKLSTTYTNEQTA